MLNLLIAIASDSYAWAKDHGPSIYRLERLSFTAELSSIERMLQERPLVKNWRLLVSHTIIALIFAMFIIYSKVMSFDTLPEIITEYKI